MTNDLCHHDNFNAQCEKWKNVQKCVNAVICKRIYFHRRKCLSSIISMKYERCTYAVTVEKSVQESVQINKLCNKVPKCAHAVFNKHVLLILYTM